MTELKKDTTLQDGKYTIQQKIGSGSFGITYLATMKAKVEGPLGSIETTIPVAIKEFFMSELNTRADNGAVEGSHNALATNYRRKFRNEAQNLGRMNHPDIVRVLEVFDENNTSYYAMEYLDGYNLDDHIRQKGALPEDEAIKLFCQLADAVGYMHRQGLLHLDIKPKNAMLRKNGSIVLIDFGLSKQYDANCDPESSTSVGGGTPGYAPIEQADYHDGKEFPVTMDIYALGATFFKMLTGQVPPIASAIVSNGFPSEILLQHNVSANTVAVIEKAMSPSKRNRYQSVDEMVMSLHLSNPDENTTIHNNTTASDEATTVDETKAKKDEEPSSKSSFSKSDFGGNIPLEVIQASFWSKHSGEIIFLCFMTCFLETVLILSNKSVKHKSDESNLHHSLR